MHPREQGPELQHLTIIRGGGECQTGNARQGARAPRPSMETIRIVVNGEERAVPAGLSLLDLIQLLNREIVRREAWTTTVVADGARLEIVQFVGGG